MEGNWLIRNHYIPRKEAYRPSDEECPIDLNYLVKESVKHIRHGIFKDPMEETQYETLLSRRPTGRDKPSSRSNPTGVNKHNRTTRKPALRVQDPENTFMDRIAKKKKGKDEVFERYMSVANLRVVLHAGEDQRAGEFLPKNEVWLYDEENSCRPRANPQGPFHLDSGRRMKMALPRAKARLITLQGFKDPDALSGALSTNAPTLTRLARGLVLCICQLYKWHMFTSDITTAFLAGQEF